MTRQSTYNASYSADCYGYTNSSFGGGPVVEISNEKILEIINDKSLRRKFKVPAWRWTYCPPNPVLKLRKPIKGE